MFPDQSLQRSSTEVQTLKQIIDNLAEGVIVANREGRLTYFNKVAEAILGMGVTDTSPQEWSECYGCYTADQTTLFPSSELPLARALKGEDVPEIEIFIRNPQRPRGVWIRARATPIWGATGLLQGGVAVFRDVTQQREADSEIQKLTRAVEQTADGILITNVDGTIEYVNPAGALMTGYSREELVGRKPNILKSGVHEAGFYAEMWTTILGGKPFTATLTNRKKCGELYLAEQTITPMMDSTGDITHFVSVLKDVTELRKSQEREFQLSLARVVQQRFYTIVPPRFLGFDIAGASFPAESTGGDYFDFVPLVDGSLGVSIGDVSGHGISSALLMAGVRAYVRAFALTTSDIGELVTRVNEVLVTDLEAEQFVTLAFCQLQASQKSLVYTSAGHLPIYSLDSRGTVHRVLQGTNVPLGFFSGITYSRSETIRLEPGEILVLLTDGMVEAEDPGGDEFGLERILGYVRTHCAEKATEIVSGLYHEVLEFSRGQQLDDATAIVCKVLDPA